MLIIMHSIFFQILYKADNSQIKSLRIGNTHARQNITYNCKNSHAHKDTDGNIKPYIKILSNDEEEIDVTGRRQNKRLDVIRDDCQIKDGKTRQAVFEYSSRRVKNLPIIDVALYDVAGENEAFGLELGPVCFS